MCTLAIVLDRNRQVDRSMIDPKSLYSIEISSSKLVDLLCILRKRTLGHLTSAPLAVGLLNLERVRIRRAEVIEGLGVLRGLVRASCLKEDGGCFARSNRDWGT